MSNATIEAGGALALLDELTRRGVSIGVNGDRLALDAPKGAIGDLLPDLQKFKPQLLELLARGASATGAHRWQDATGAPDKSAIAPDVLPDLSRGEAAAILAKYRRGGALLSLETVNGAAALAIEIPASFSSAKCEGAFAMLEQNGLAIYRALEMEAAQQNEVTR